MISILMAVSIGFAVVGWYVIKYVTGYKKGVLSHWTDTPKELKHTADMLNDLHFYLMKKSKVAAFGQWITPRDTQYRLARGLTCGRLEINVLGVDLLHQKGNKSVLVIDDKGKSCVICEGYMIDLSSGFEVKDFVPKNKYNYFQIRCKVAL